MKYKLTLIAAFVAFAISSSAQTTAEEYDYLTKGYREDIAKGKVVRKGYELKHINSIFESNAFVEVRVVYRFKGILREKASYLLIYKNDNSDSEYFCSPSPKSDTVIISKYWKQLNENALSDPLKKKLVSMAVSKVIHWSNDKKDTSEIYTTEPSNVMTGEQGGLAKYLMQNLNSSAPSEHGSPSGQYTVSVSYTVDILGKIGNVVAENDPGYGTAEEAVRVIKKAPDGKPALRDGKPAEYKGSQKITFVVSDGKVPMFPDGDNFIKAKAKDGVEWGKYVHNSFNLAVPYYNRAPNGQYSVQVFFCIDSMGVVSKARVNKDPDYGIAKEAIRVINNSPNWIPAAKDGKAVESWSNYTITIDLKR